MKLLVTGIAGYIGSHAAVTLLAAAGHDIVGVDNFANSSPEALRRVKALAGRDFDFAEADIRDAAALEGVFARRRIDAVIHFAGLKAVAESVVDPLAYFATNVGGSVNLLNACRRHGCRTFLFSSSATVYGNPDALPIREDASLRPFNPYGQTKRTVEDILGALAASEPGWRVGCLRYFNPVGAHESGRIGENPRGTPNNLMPLVVDAAAGRHERLDIYGKDWPTRDGTGVRDYIHVMDLAEGHLAALERLARHEGSFTVNLGTGRGYSVLEIVGAFERVNAVRVPHRFAARRPGDVAEVFADVSLARSLLGWTARRDLDAMCRDHWRWRQQNPNGYAGA